MLVESLSLTQAANITPEPTTIIEKTAEKSINFPEWWPSELALPSITSWHESQHALVAFLKFGVPVELVSRKPGPGYRGITICAGDLRHRPYALQVIAAAGAVDPIGMKAEGYGNHLLPCSDLNIAYNLSYYTRTSVSEAVKDAEKFLSVIPKSAREIVAAVIETNGTIIGADNVALLIDIAFRLAEEEIDLESLRTASRTKDKDVCNEEDYISSVNRGDRTIIIAPVDAPKSFIVIPGGEKNNLSEEKDDPSQLPCKECNNKVKHAESCSRGREKTKRFIESIIVFDARKHLGKG
jgi:hypothetical protein